MPSAFWIDSAISARDAAALSEAGEELKELLFLLRINDGGKRIDVLPGLPG
jgi:hypothetical protein